MLARAARLALPLTLVACGAHPSRPPDAAAGLPPTNGAHDLAVAMTPPDAAGNDTGHDGGAVDMPTPLTPPDLASPDLAPSLPIIAGLNWPPGQQFPSFGTVGALDVIDLGGMANDEETLFVTLAGLVNRAQPRIYTLDNGGEGKTFWLDKIGVTVNNVADPFTLITKYRANVNGVVITDDMQPDTRNLATTIAGLQGGIVASPALATTLTAAPYALPVLVDLRANHFASKLAVYQYELDTYGAGATRRLICGLDPAIAGHLRDYAVATEAMMVWLDPRNSDEKTLLGKFLSRLLPNSPYLGWWPDESSGVSTAATAGIPVFAADYASNLTVFGGTPRGIAVPTPPAKPALATKLYITMIMSDGDNLQENQHLIPIKWNDANRGKAPIAWTTTPALVDTAPLILNYYWTTATANDVMISGPSGLGYTYPDWWPTAIFGGYTTTSARYLAAAGLRAITIWNLDPLISGNDGKDLSAADAMAYTQDMPHLLGLTMQGGYIALLHERTVLDGALPLVYLAQTYGNNEADLEAGIDNAGKVWSKLGPDFVAVQGNMNSDGISPTTFYNVQQHYTGNNDYVFVRADHFFMLLREAQGLTIDP
jgi:hypothetical protein